MPSPFPGMNPYFEQPGVWRGFHLHLVVKLLEEINRRFLPVLYANLEVREYLDYDTDESPVADPPTVLLGTLPTGPITGRLPRPIKRNHRWLTLRDTATREVVTVIEVLSPSNKRGEDRGNYLRKRRRLLRSTAHLVEIDLLRGGPRMPVAGVPASDYQVMVSRQPQRPDVQVWPIALRGLLPAVPIPFRTGEPEPLIDLKPLIDEVYDRGGYRYQLYTNPPDPPLSPADADWARQFLSAAS